MPDLMFESRVWWPTAGVSVGRVDETENRIELINAGQAGVVLVAARSDWSLPYEPRQIFRRGEVGAYTSPDSGPSPTI